MSASFSDGNPGCCCNSRDCRKWREAQVKNAGVSQGVRESLGGPVEAMHKLGEGAAVVRHELRKAGERIGVVQRLLGSLWLWGCKKPQSNVKL